MKDHSDGRVGDYIKISAPIEFVNTGVCHDTELFVRPSAVKHGTTQWAEQARECISSFFDEINRCANSADLEDQRKGREMCGHLSEPKWTHLGYSVAGHAGHALGEGLGDEVWDAFRTDPLCRQKVTEDLETLAIFHWGISDDRVSDVTSQICTQPLVDFTDDQINRHPELAPYVEVTGYEAWDSAQQAWTTRHGRFLNFGYGGMLLVPQEFTSGAYAKDRAQFYRIVATDQIQQESIWMLPNGSIQKDSKLLIYDRHPDQPKTNTEVTTRMLCDEDRNLVREYEDLLNKDPKEPWPDRMQSALAA